MPKVWVPPMHTGHSGTASNRAQPPALSPPDPQTSVFDFEPDDEPLLDPVDDSSLLVNRDEVTVDPFFNA
jgi:hypothetical protein